MSPIYFLAAFAFICQLSTSSGQFKLEYYDAQNKDLDVLRVWYNMVKNPLDESKAMKQLEDEAKNTANKRGTKMNEYLNRAKNLNKRVNGLTRAECLVVSMYTDDSSPTAFYREYNTASINRNWQPYRFYTTLLVSAIRKLAHMDPVPPGTILYRGVSFRPVNPTPKRIFWKTFTSTSLSYEISKGFAGANGILMTFQMPPTRFAGRVRKLSYFPDENEVILLPFEAYDVAGITDKQFNFQSSRTQALLIPGGDHIELRDGDQGGGTGQGDSG